RAPAPFAGLSGPRPSHGRVDLTGAMAMAPSFDVAGWFASGPGVFRRVGAVLLGGEAVAAPVERLLVATDAFAQADVEVGALGREFLKRAAGLLPRPTELAAAPDGFDGWREAFRIVQAKEVWETFGDFVTRAKPKLGPGIKERVAFAATVTADQAAAARKTLAAGRAHLRALLAPSTIMALPTAPSIAPPVDSSAAEMESFRTRVMRLTSMAGIAG